MSPRRERSGARRSAGPPAAAGPALAKPRQGLAILLAAVAAACVLVSVTFPIYDPDIWQHLAVGRWIWEHRVLPHIQIWTWPTYGAPDVPPSWLFRVLLWPFWEAGGGAGLFVWRWLTTLAAFVLMWRIARRLGAHDGWALLALVIAALVWRQRTMARPETLAAILLALELLLLEARRAGGRDHALWIAPLLWVWVQAHVSFVFGFAVLAIYAVADLRRPAGRPGWLAVALAASLLLAPLGPYGLALVRQPFDFFLHQRHEPLFRTIDELRSPDWAQNLRNGLPLFLVVWPLLAVFRGLRGKWDWVELALAAVFVTVAWTSQRFMGFAALVGAPFLARDVSELLTRGRATAPLGVRGALVFGGAMVLVCLAEWLRPEPRPGFGLDLRGLPEHATEFMAAHGVRGRGFNYFYHGGWLLWRFDAARDRLPFMDIHQAGTPEIREEYRVAFSDSAAWRRLMAQHTPEWLLLRRPQLPGDGALDFADRDSAYACVFLDDAAALFVRRAGPLRAVADSFGYREIPAGTGGLAALGQAVEGDEARRTQVAAELERLRAASPRHGFASSLLANVAMIEGRWADARRLLLEARALEPGIGKIDERLAIIARYDSAAAAPR